jgi:hypothetical protein
MQVFTRRNFAKAHDELRAKFPLIDHSLKAIGGHHYDYALHILQAAEQVGFEIHLATHRGF